MLQPFLTERFAGKATRVAMYFMVLAAIILVLAQIKPFWVDEWRIIYNLKYKDPGALFGPLELVQQFPRLYLVVIKLFAAPFEYSYFILRFPSLLTGTVAIWLAHHLMNKLYKPGNASRYLFLLIIISSHTFTTYYIQVKQYSMDILISLIALWQLLQLLHLLQNRLQSPARYSLLLLSLAITPFFSYTYPLVAIPMFITIMVAALRQENRGKGLFTTRKILPFVVAVSSISAFVVTDASRASNNTEMRIYWAYLMMQKGFDWQSFLRGLYVLFAETGSGLLFQVIFGITGLTAFVIALIKLPHLLTSGKGTTQPLVLLYAVLVVTLAFVFYVAGKLPIGEPRLNAFTLPSIAILLLAFIRAAANREQLLKPVQGFVILIYAGTIGHVFTASAHQITFSGYKKKLAIYERTEDAITAAQALGTPIFITSDIAYPDDHIVVYPNTNIVAESMCRPLSYGHSLHFNYDTCLPGDWVLKTFPAYKTKYHLPVYAIDDTAKVDQYLDHLPATVDVAVVGDGTHYRTISRRCR